MRKPHTVEEILMLPVATDMLETMLGESYAKELRGLHLQKAL